MTAKQLLTGSQRRSAMYEKKTGYFRYRKILREKGIISLSMNNSIQSENKFIRHYFKTTYFPYYPCR
jgi:Fe-S cluster assembly scaffold protein SufB